MSDALSWPSIADRQGQTVMGDGHEDGKGQALGVALVLASAAVFSLSGVLTKVIVSDAWTIACWRGLFGAVLISIYVWIRRDQGPEGSGLRLGWRGWLLASVGALASIAFISAFKLTYVANVAIIYATAPFAAAVLERLLLGAQPRRATMTAAAAALLGVTIMVFGGLGTGNLLGDAVAVLMTLGNALYMVLIRAFHDTPVVWAGAASAFQLFLVGWLLTDPLAVSAEDALLLTLFGASFAIALILWTEGTRLISAAESGLLGAAEVPLAILLAWLILAEMPPTASFIGGAVVLIAVFRHAVSDVVRSRVLRYR